MTGEARIPTQHHQHPYRHHIKARNVISECGLVLRHTDIKGLVVSRGCAAAPLTSHFNI